MVALARGSPHCMPWGLASNADNRVNARILSNIHIKKNTIKYNDINIKQTN